ncbi:MAG: hypothetical protein KJ556_17415 [Gammaproteobacteria bacterium]|nr:hypothetical protein [Gammaproteobacteria bacterium]MBU2058156.1 hypothetical protein [Gammaproteobacteria bacterium]MBU2176891.1 hypothetical protein [Gammaproteobacteria bacterium]MBU2245570.1 hypothetical protein [Gammaproteobacteria bacterium]MBU2342738.1 hypothetical protein [Gammaproteobacteria bacterium]
MLKNLSIKTRLFAIVGVAVLGQLLVCWLVLSGLKQSILEESAFPLFICLRLLWL